MTDLFHSLLMQLSNQLMMWHQCSADNPEASVNMNIKHQTEMWSRGSECGELVSDGPDWVFLKLLIYWDFNTQQSLEFLLRMVWIIGSLNGSMESTESLKAAIIDFFGSLKASEQGWNNIWGSCQDKRNMWSLVYDDLTCLKTLNYSLLLVLRYWRHNWFVPRHLKTFKMN